MDDLISRAEAIKAMYELEQDDIETYGVKIPEGFDGERAAEALNCLPNLAPIEMTGRWLVDTDCEGKTRTCTCDLCGYKTGKYTWKNPNYCANCGARMIKEFEIDG